MQKEQYDQCSGRNLPPVKPSDSCNKNVTKKEVDLCATFTQHISQDPMSLKMNTHKNTDEIHASSSFREDMYRYS